jgi:hypothetical protein
VVLIVATDGVPSNCGDLGGAGTPEASILAALAGAFATSPAISTYAIGVFAPGEDPAGPMFVNSIATAGGTGMAFVLDPTKDLTQELLDALAQIRGSALPCSFTIPPPRSGAIDFGKVNVHSQSSGGQTDVPYVGSAAKCDPTRGGWYYDVDPAAGDPTQVIVCDATCAAFKAEQDGQVEIGFGCKTRVIQ